MNRKYQHKNFIDLIEYLDNTKPNETAFTFIEEKNHCISMDYHELVEKIQRIAALIQQYAAPNDRVILIYKPGLDLITAFLGCLCAGTIAVLVYPPATEDLVKKLQHIITNAQPSLCLSTTEIAKKIKTLRFAKWSKNIPILQHLTKRISRLSDWDFDKLQWLTTDSIPSYLAGVWRPPVIRKNSIAFLQYTSGSTGKPKGVIVTHNNIWHNLTEIKNQFNLINENEETVFWLPPYHDMGLIAGILGPIFMASPARLMSPITFLKSPLIWLETITKYQSTITSAPNFAFSLCVHRITDEQKTKLDLHSMRNAIVGGEPVHRNTLEEFVKVFSPCGFSASALKPCYGLAENTLLVSGVKYDKQFSNLRLHKKEFFANQLKFTNEDNEGTLSLISSGEVISNHKVLIVNPKTKVPCPANTIGEVWVSGPCVSPGYWRKAKTSRKIMKASVTKEKGKFLRTGDLGFIKDGEVFICGRMKDVIIIRGRNYYPQDIEMAIEENLPKSIRHGCSIAFSTNILEQERLVIIVELRKNNQDNIKELCHQIIQTTVEKFGLRPYHIVFVPEKTLKKTTSGKVRRYYNKKQFINLKLDVIYLWTDSDTEVKINTINDKVF